MSEEKEIKYDLMYNSDFQRQSVKLICTNLKFALSHIDIFRNEYFESQPLRILFPLIRDYIFTYNKEIDESSLNVLVDDYSVSHSLSSEMVASLRKEVKDVFRMHIPDEQFIKDKIVKFCRRQEMKSAFIKGIDILQRGDDEEKCRNLVDNALSVGSGTTRTYGYDTLLDIQDEYIQSFDPSKMVKTGYPTLDKAMQGGLAPGEVHILLAPPKSGKTTMLTNIGGNALKQGKNVFHATLEIKPTFLMMKYASLITGLPYEDILSMDKESYQFKINRFIQSTGGNLHVNYWTEMSATTMDLRSWICQIKSTVGDSPDIIIIDYDDCLLPTKGASDSMYENSGVVYADMIALADYFECPVYTASQPKREAWEDADNDKLISASKVAHSGRKIHRCTSVTSINGSKDNPNVARLYLDINRRGEGNVVIPVVKEFERSRIREANNNNNGI